LVKHKGSPGLDVCCVSLLTAAWIYPSVEATILASLRL